jgi:hypothetical protein
MDRLFVLTEGKIVSDTRIEYVSDRPTSQIRFRTAVVRPHYIIDEIKQVHTTLPPTQAMPAMWTTILRALKTLQQCVSRARFASMLYTCSALMLSAAPSESMHV